MKNHIICLISKFHIFLSDEFYFIIKSENLLLKINLINLIILICVYKQKTKTKIPI